MYASYKDIPKYLERKATFQGNSMSAEYRGNGKYHVISYSTTIATFDPTTGEVDIPDIYYSPTTSRHQNLARTYL